MSCLRTFSSPFFTSFFPPLLLSLLFLSPLPHTHTPTHTHTHTHIGWQPRWFILDSGILSYYLGPSEVNQGCRGSLKVASCDITGGLQIGSGKLDLLFRISYISYVLNLCAGQQSLRFATSKRYVCSAKLQRYSHYKSMCHNLEGNSDSRSSRSQMKWALM